MPSRTRPLVALLVTLAAGCSGSAYSFGRSAEKPAIVVLDVKGKRGNKARGAIIELVEADYRLIPRKRYVATARKLEATRLRARHIREVSAELGLSAVITGRVKRRGKRWYLYVVVHDGSSGERVDRFRVRLTRRRALTERGIERLESKLTAALGEARPPPEGDEVVADDRDKAGDKAERDKAEAERDKAERDKAERDKAEAERKRAEAERKKAEAERKKAEREKERDAEVIEEVAEPETTDSGQVIDEEEPPGF